MTLSYPWIIGANILNSGIYLYIFDIFVLVLLVYGVVSGIFRGFFKEVGSIIALLLAFLITFSFGDNLAEIIKSKPALAGYGNYVTVVTYVLLFFVAVVAVNLIVSFLHYFVLKFRTLKWFSRLGGAVVGFVKGWLVAIIIYFLLITFAPFIDRYIENSKSAPYLANSAKKMQVMVADTFNNQSFRNILYPPEIKSAAPAPQTEAFPVTPGAAANEPPLYIPDDDLLFTDSFE